MYLAVVTEKKGSILFLSCQQTAWNLAAAGVGDGCL